MSFKTVGSRSPIVIGLVVVVLIAAGSAFAASGVGALVTGGEGSAVSARASQQALGAVSATPLTVVPRPPGGGGGTSDPPPQGGGGSDVATQRGTHNSDVATQRGTHKTGGKTPETSVTTTPASGKAVVGGSGATGGNLPFTGFLAIPVLLGGAALLLVGLGLRRRAPSVA